MSNFLFVVPINWTQLDWDYVTVNVPGMVPNNINDFIATRTFGPIEESLKAYSLIPQNSTVLDALLFDNSFFAVLLG